MQYRITISLRCYGRPQRTMRAIQNVLDQTINGWELLLTGDCCPYFDNSVFQDFINNTAIPLAEKNGNRIVFKNHIIHLGGCGYAIINHHIAAASGKYFIFLSNDDVILPNHAENYLSGIEGSPYKWVYFDTWLRPAGAIRVAQLEFGKIGHSELIIETDFLKSMPPHTKEYGHDWLLVQSMMKKTFSYKKVAGAPATYKVMSVPGNQEQGID